MLGPHLTNWSVRAALLLYLLSTAREISSGRRDTVARYAWLGGCLAFLVHVFCAFYFHHDMSHQAAVANTAERTRDMLGFAFGEGIFFSYAFTVIWTVDAFWRVFAAESYDRRAVWLHGAVHAYLFFIAINGAAVFEAGATRWGAVLGCLLLAGLAIGRWRSSNAHSREKEAALS